MATSKDITERLEHQEMVTGQLVVSLAEMAAALEAVVSVSLSELDEEGQARFVDQFEQNRKNMFQAIQGLNDEYGDEASEADAATMAVVAERMQSPAPDQQ